MSFEFKILDFTNLTSFNFYGNYSQALTVGAVDLTNGIKYKFALNFHSKFCLSQKPLTISHFALAESSNMIILRMLLSMMKGIWTLVEIFSYYNKLALNLLVCDSNIIWTHSIHRSLHIYIHNSPLQPFSRDYGLDPYTTYAVCVNSGTYSLTSTPRFWETVSWQFYWLSEFSPKIYWEKITEEIFFFSYFVLMPDLDYEPDLYVC